jgi:hypothetical protein
MLGIVRRHIRSIVLISFLFLFLGVALVYAGLCTRPISDSHANDDDRLGQPHGHGGNEEAPSGPVRVGHNLGR